MLLQHQDRQARLQVAADKTKQKFLGGHNQHQHRRPTDRVRVALYSHDTMGIGHMRRNLLIAQKIHARFPKVNVLNIAGANEANLFARHAGIDCVSLPSYQKSDNGTYRSRHLEIPGEQLLELRRQTILAAIRSYRPHILIVDKVPAGAGGEMIPALEWVSRNSDCRCVLGLREILDDPQTVDRDWQATDTLEVIRTFFDDIWIYGDPQIFDAVSEYELPDDIRDRVSYTGYLDTRIRLNALDDALTSLNGHAPKGKYVLCTVGGGQDGEQLAQTFVRAVKHTDQPSVLLTGPHMPEPAKEQIGGLAAGARNLSVIDFIPEGDVLLQGATHVVSMGGYNTICSILAYRKHALVVPRIRPRTEQLIRANGLSRLGLVDTLHPDDLTPQSIGGWLKNSQPCQRPKKSVDLSGLDRICDLLSHHVQTASLSIEQG